jgi:hypothetical protein
MSNVTHFRVTTPVGTDAKQFVEDLLQRGRSFGHIANETFDFISAPKAAAKKKTAKKKVRKSR